ncbi:hypothetical protein Tco_1408089 [Tanacetum coccineum]
MMTNLKHVGGKKHSDLKTKSFAEIQVLYEKIKRSDDSFIAIGSAEDEKIIKQHPRSARSASKDKDIGIGMDFLIVQQKSDPNMLNVKVNPELKVEFEKLMRSIESFVPMGSEERVKRAGVQLEKESSKKQKIVVEDVPVTKEKVAVVKKEEPIKRTGKRKKQKARKDHVWKSTISIKYARIGRYYDNCRVHCLTLESANIYMLTERRYPIPADVCQAMLDKKLQGNKKDEACY